MVEVWQTTHDFTQAGLSDMGHPMTLTVMSRHLRIMGLVPAMVTIGEGFDHKRCEAQWCSFAIVDSGTNTTYKIVDPAGGANYELTEKDLIAQLSNLTCPVLTLTEPFAIRCQIWPRSTRSTSVPPVVVRLKARNARVETLVPPVVSLVCVVHGWDCTHVRGSPSSLKHVVEQRIRAAVLEFDTSSTRANPLVCSPAVMTDQMLCSS